MSEISPAEQLAGTLVGSAISARRNRRRPAPVASANLAEDPVENPADGIGRRVAAYRLDRGMRVSDLAREVGVSPSLVSQIERGQSRPSVSTLFAIAQALDVAVDAFFRETDPEPQTPPTPTAVDHRPGHRPDHGGMTERDGRAGADRGGHEDRYVVRRADRPVIDIESGVRWERLTPGPLKNVEFLELIYGPGAESSSTLYRHPGEEMILILSGELDIYLGFERYHLLPGDSMHFSSMQPHRYVNPTDETTRAVTTILHDGAWYATPHAGENGGFEGQV
nr:XRE family transcriptional regulator [Micromonospora sp. DSM 115978]